MSNYYEIFTLFSLRNVAKGAGLCSGAVISRANKQTPSNLSLCSPTLSIFEHDSKKESTSRGGFTILELVVTLAIAGIILTTAISNINVLDRPLATGALQLSGFIKETRARAIATTSAYTIQPFSSTELKAYSAINCDSEDLVEDPKLQYELPRTVSLTNTEWSLCITARGLVEESIEITVQGEGFETKTIEVFLGGAVRTIL